MSQEADSRIRVDPDRFSPAILAHPRISSERGSEKRVSALERGSEKRVSALERGSECPRASWDTRDTRDTQKLVSYTPRSSI
jgi:hypothetical protein